MKTVCFIFTLIIFNIALCCAQDAAIIYNPLYCNPRNPNEKIITDTCILRISYRFKYYLDKNKKKLSYDNKALEIGLSHNHFYSLIAQEKDLLLNPKSTQKATCSHQEMTRLDSGIYEDIFTNMPSLNKRITIRRIINRDYVYIEPCQDITWNIRPEMDTILGYQCQMATGMLGGRHWNAWFSTEIPVKYGPWKLNGLPGLILKASDADEYFEFIATSIEKPTQTYIYKYKSRPKLISIAQYHKLIQMIWESPSVLFQAHGIEFYSGELYKKANAIKQSLSSVADGSAHYKFPEIPQLD